MRYQKVNYKTLLDIILRDH